MQDYYRQTQLAYVQDVDELKMLAKARAIEVATDLMLNAKSETVRARMAEFLAGDGKAPSVSVVNETTTGRPAAFAALAMPMASAV